MVRWAVGAAATIVTVRAVQTTRGKVDIAAHSGRSDSGSVTAPLIRVQKDISAINYPKQHNEMGTSRLQVSVLIVAVWTAAVATSVSTAPQSAPAGAKATAPAPPSAGSPNHQQVVTKYCAGCHNQRATTSATVTGVVLDRADLSRIGDEAAMWEKVIKKLRAGAMPPAGMPRPDDTTMNALVSFLETTLDRTAAEHPNPGRHLPHRLNRAEYENADRKSVV